MPRPAKWASAAEYIHWLASRGGKARASVLTSEERSASASRASKAKWKKVTPAKRTAQARKAAAARWRKKKAR